MMMVFSIYFGVAGLFLIGSAFFSGYRSVYYIYDVDIVMVGLLIIIWPFSIVALSIVGLFLLFRKLGTLAAKRLKL